MKFDIIYEDENVLTINKPPGIVVFSEKPTIKKTLAQLLIEQFPYLKDVHQPPRYGIVHRLDKDTSGILLVAKNRKSLFFLQEQFQKRKVEKKYIALVIGIIKKEKGEVKTLIGRSPKDRKKQKAYLPFEPKSEGKREAVTEYRVLTRFHQRFGSQEKYYTLVEVMPKTGRKHQIRTHFHYLGHPIAGDKLYSFKNQTIPQGLERQFLHASFLKIILPEGKKRELRTDLPEDLSDVLKNLNEYNP
jgi:23S rRNA pseudouridine1911/1915/1917 synthase